MTIRTFPKMYSARTPASGQDRVMFAFPIPGGAVINNAWMEVSTMFPDIDVKAALQYSLFGYIIPVLDLDAGVTPDIMWDNQVPKDQADDTADTIDIDRHTALDDPVAELGDINIHALLDLKDGPRQVFRRETLLNFPKSPTGFKTGTPDTYYAMDHVKAKMSGTYRITAPSYYIVAVGVATGADTDATFPSINTRGEWMQLAYMKDALVDAMKAMAGLAVSGTQEPYTEAMVLIHSYLEHVIEDTAGTWGTGSANVWGKMTMDITLPGDFDVAQLSSSA